MTPEEEQLRLAVQRRNARVLALILGALVALIFALASVKIGLGWDR